MQYIWAQLNNFTLPATHPTLESNNLILTPFSHPDPILLLHPLLSCPPQTTTFIITGKGQGTDLGNSTDSQSGMQVTLQPRYLFSPPRKKANGGNRVLSTTTNNFFIYFEVDSQGRFFVLKKKEGTFCNIASFKIFKFLKSQLRIRKDLRVRIIREKQKENKGGCTVSQWTLLPWNAADDRRSLL